MLHPVPLIWPAYFFASRVDCASGSLWQEARSGVTAVRVTLHTRLLRGAWDAAAALALHGRGTGHASTKLVMMVCGIGMHGLPWQGVEHVM